MVNATMSPQMPKANRALAEEDELEEEDMDETAAMGRGASRDSRIRVVVTLAMQVGGVLLRRVFSTKIPDGAIELKFIKSSGPGGQHVNKTSSACEARMQLAWLPSEVRLRLAQQQRTHLNDRNELVVTSQEERSQHRNRAKVVAKLQTMVDLAFVEPKVRQLVTDVSEQTKANWIREKRLRSAVKQARKSNWE
jgi:ribosome-associated protein